MERTWNGSTNGYTSLLTPRPRKEPRLRPQSSGSGRIRPRHQKQRSISQAEAARTTMAADGATLKRPAGGPGGPRGPQAGAAGRKRKKRRKSRRISRRRRGRKSRSRFRYILPFELCFFVPKCVVCVMCYSREKPFSFYK